MEASGAAWLTDWPHRGGLDVNVVDVGGEGGIQPAPAPGPDGEHLAVLLDQRLLGIEFHVAWQSDRLIAPALDRVVIAQSHDVKARR
jgi:hypothetical protein